MRIYLSFIMIVFILMLAYEVTQKKIFYIITTFAMAIFAGIRYKVGTDYIVYEMMFESSRNQAFKGYEGDIGFLFISKIINAFTENIRWHFFIISSAIVIAFMIYIYKNSKFELLSVMMYITIGGYFASFNIMRQYIAIGIILFAVKYIGTKKNCKYYALIVLATLFHTTAIIMIPIKILVELKWNKVIYICLAISTIVLAPNINLILMNMDKGNRIGEYANSYYTSNGSNPIGFLVVLSIYMFGYIYTKNNKSLRENKFYKLMYIGILFSFLSLKGLIFARIASYFNIANMIFIPNIWREVKGRDRKILIYVILICLIIYMIFSIYTQGGILPYRIN